MSFGPDEGEITGFDPDRDPLVGLRADVDRIVALEPSAMADAELATEVVRLRRQMDRLDAVWAEWSLAAERRQVGMADGHPSTRAWLAWQSGRSRGEINRTIRRAETAERLPETGQAWRAGGIPTGAVELIDAARVEGCEDEFAACEAQFLDFARRRDHRSLRIVTQHFRKYALADGRGPEIADGLTLSPVGDRYAVRGDFSADAAEIVTHALAQFTLPPSPCDGSSAAQRRANGFVRICEVALGRGPEAETPRPAVSYVTHAPDEDGRPLTLGQLTGVIGPADRERLLCDATLTTVTVGRDGNVLDVGRATRIWPTAIRKAVVVQHAVCVWPGCEVPAGWCDVHHHVHWEHGGCTSARNGYPLCRSHHTFVHRHPDWTTTFFEQRFRVFRPDGRELLPDPWGEPPPDDPTEQVTRAV